MFENLIQIISNNKNESRRLSDEIKFGPYSNDFIQVKEVKTSDLGNFVEALKSFNEKLNELISDIYQNEELQNLRDVHDNMLKELCKKELHINYLLKDMNSVKLKIDAYHQTLNEKELRVKELADKKNLFRAKLLNLRNIKRTRKPQMKPVDMQIIPFIRPINWTSNLAVQTPRIEEIKNENSEGSTEWLDVE